MTTLEGVEPGDWASARAVEIMMPVMRYFEQATGRKFSVNDVPVFEKALFDVGRALREAHSVTAEGESEQRNRKALESEVLRHREFRNAVMGWREFD